MNCCYYSTLYDRRSTTEAIKTTPCFFIMKYDFRLQANSWTKSCIAITSAKAAAITSAPINLEFSCFWIYSYWTMINYFANLDELASAVELLAHIWWSSVGDRHFGHYSDCTEPSWMFSGAMHGLYLVMNLWRFEFLVCLSCSKSQAAFISNYHHRHSMNLSALLPYCSWAAVPS